MPESGPLPQTFGKYTLVDRIAAGGMAEVYRAKIYGVAGFEKTVAVKRILPHFAEDEGFVDMFVREANIAVKLAHSNIVQVFELGRVGENYYIALEFVEGRDLKSLVRQAASCGRPLAPELVAWIVQRICAGLHHAHVATDEDGSALGIIHRDVSPHNVLLSWTGEVKVADFGIAKLQSGARHTQTGMLKGKLAYMSPEQAEGDPSIDARSDVFAAGVVLYECLTGVRPFEGQTDREILRAVRDRVPPAPSTLVAGIPAELDAIVARAMAKSRDHRYPDAAAMGKALGAVLQRMGSASGRVVDSEDLAETMRDLLGPRPASPRTSSPAIDVRGGGGARANDGFDPTAGGAGTGTGAGKGGTPILPMGVAGDQSAPSLVRTRNTGPDASQIFAAAPAESTTARPSGWSATAPQGLQSQTSFPLAQPSRTFPSERAPGRGPLIAAGIGGVVLVVAVSFALPSIRRGLAPAASPGAVTAIPTPYAEPTPMAVTAPSGALLVEGTPAGATISIGDRVIGKLGETIGGIAAGSRSVTVSADGYRAQTLPVDVAAGGVTTHKVALVRGRGEVRISRPLRKPYQVRIPGVTNGFTSLAVLRVPAGTHRTEIKDGEKTYKATLVVRDGATTVMKLPEVLTNGATFK